LRRDEDHALRKALSFKVEGQRKRGQPRKTWRRQVEEEIRGIGLWNEDALDRARWRIHGGSDVHSADPFNVKKKRIETGILLILPMC